MILQGQNLPNEAEVNEIKRRKLKEQKSSIVEKVQKVEERQPVQTAKAIHDARMPAASSWLSVLPLAEYGFALNKGEFRDAINLRYGKPFKGLPSHVLAVTNMT